MSRILRVRWTVTSAIAPQPLIACTRCGAVRPFKSSGKTRLNANGKRLSAWLIYRCITCEETWNRPMFERQSVNSIEPHVLHALQRNDAEWINALAFDLEHLRKPVREFAEVDVKKHLMSTGPGPWSELEIVFEVPLSTSMRLDRLLAGHLNVSRTDIGRLHKRGLLTTSPASPKALRKPVSDRLRVIIDLSCELGASNLDATKAYDDA